jgi:hypothetical protein
MQLPPACLRSLPAIAVLGAGFLLCPSAPAQQSAPLPASAQPAPAPAVPVQSTSPAVPPPSLGTPPKLQPGQLAPGQLPVDKRIFGVLPNYRTANESAVYSPISKKRKLYIATKDSTDAPIFANAAVLSLIAQADNSHPGFGQGTIGYGQRYGTALADQLIGNYLTEGVMPVLLHEDPRYFRRGHGSKWSRIGYATSRIFVTKTDTGATTFNFSEVIGNGIAAGIANAYYPQERSVLDNVQRLWTQLATDAVSQVLKEFWPDIKRHYHNKHHPNDQWPPG